MTRSFRTYTIREHESVHTDIRESDKHILVRDYPSVFKYSNKGQLRVANLVGQITLSSDITLEILPKIDIGHTNESVHERTREILLTMLRHFRRLPMHLRESNINKLKHSPMLSIFAYLFLVQLTELVKRGLARSYVPTESKLPYLRGRLLFKEALQTNIVDQSKFFVRYDNFSEDRPINRLIASTLNLMKKHLDHVESQKLHNISTLQFSHIQASTNILADWQVRNLDRSMLHYKEVIQWIGLFLFGHSLGPYTGEYRNLSVLFPMEQVFEDFVTAHIRLQLFDLEVVCQERSQSILKNDKFRVKPDIVLRQGSSILAILDAKWKEINQNLPSRKFHVSQPDLYQLYAYSRVYKCKQLALIYPKNRNFESPKKLEYFDGRKLVLFPFDIEHPRDSVEELSNVLELDSI
ncbi:MAG: hypothetical protein F4039_06730 [Gammaproteobacteria bacterium]|nr:hypothetical protein [Gammaproteobacteria bacterium]MYF53049.1 hypothetical protein [Gammaproteobacteria bacterium]MYK43764.1 hypothetical protein [Gammaproteobacteria bacterium]